MSTQEFITFLLVGSFFPLFSLLPTTISDSSHEVDMHRQFRRELLLSSTIRQYLVAHNQVRASLHLPPLKWSSKLADYAAWWANQRRGDCALIHSDSNYGENIFWGAGSNWRPVDAVNIWAAKGRYYNYWLNTCAQNEDCSHYTQIVWRKSTWLGCAKVVCVNRNTFITCNYDPHGNVIGLRPF